MKQIINLADGTRVEIDGTNVKHINANGHVRYDSTCRVLHDEEQIEQLMKSINLPPETMATVEARLKALSQITRKKGVKGRSRNISPTVESMLENLRPYLEEDIDE